MASIMRRKPAPRRESSTPRASKGQVRRVSPLKPGLRNARNWATAHMRAATYSRRGALRMFSVIASFTLFILFSGLWLGGFLPDIRNNLDEYSRTRLIAMGFVVDHVDVVGEGRILENEVQAALGIRPGDYLFETDLRAAQQRVQSLPWVNDAMVRRLWPDRYVVHIIERRPMAMWQSEQQLRVIDTDGRIIEAALPEDFAALPRFIGAGASQNAKAFLVSMTSAPLISEQVDLIIRVGNRRWDLQLKDSGARILLPENGADKALLRLSKYHDSHRILDLDIETIDLRLPDRMIARPRQDAGSTVYVKRKGEAA
ncbi:cell division protein FtsQ/DivIB [Robiginitomaculum antarcticum]|uniref:cell division protein FtsQ/DivIB n=1 Tax=Robiginitomaculum antarcticum TaxID=437507 RepID=UPI00037DE9B8|nr:FtsQ-type POTRA domain-containing protein [Robiginitomaculum antarcticum]